VKGKSKTDSAEMRRRIEESRSLPSELQQPEMRRLLEELQIHQFELEMQNEELRTARMEIEVALARYTELFDFAPIGYATLDEGGTIREINHAGARLLGQERRRLVGQPFAALIEPGQGEVFSRLLGAARASDAREMCLIDLRRFDSTGVKLRLSAVTLAHSAVAGRAVLLAFEDITEWFDRERKLASTERALRAADRRKNEFLAVLSHELRNPLAPIRNSLYVLARAKPGTDKARKAQAVIERQTAHLTHLVDDLLDVTRIARGKVQLHRERLELGELLRSTIDDQRTTFEANGIRIESHIERGDFWVHVDPARIVQALSNLLGNAEKFTPQGGNVKVSLQRSGESVVLRVRDSGVGIADDMGPHLFEPFSQAPQSMDRTRGGLGLGLAMTKGLIELHDGTVTVASAGPGQGTTATVTLPLEATPPPAAASAPQAPLRSRRVLVVDDNRDAADTLRDALALSGHEVEVSYDGPSGVEHARKLRPEIVICDIGLPRMDGYEVARALRADQALRGIYLVALTGYGMPDDVEHATAAGFDLHVTKPSNLEKLCRIVSDAPVMALDD
jgi:two-component system CheB/CheR fusion protein